MKKLFFFAFFIANINSFAQVSITANNYQYSQDFNSLDTVTVGTGSSNLPQGWSIYGWGSGTQIITTYRANIGTSITGAAYSFGQQAVAERALGSVCTQSLPKIVYGVKFKNNTGVTVNSLVISFKQEQWHTGYRHAVDTTMDSTRFFYSLHSNVNDTSFSNWTEMPSLMLKTIQTDSTQVYNLNGNLVNTFKHDTLQVVIPDGDSISIRWYDWNSAGNNFDDGNAIDSINILFTTLTPAVPKPKLLYKSPSDNAYNLPVSLSNIKMAFNRHVSKGTGNIILSNETDGTNQTINVTNTSVVVNADTVNVSGIVLDFGKIYHVTFDSTAFDTAGFNSYGLYDTTAWNFATVPAPPTSINENFDTACANNALPYGWSRLNYVGAAQQWACGGGTSINKYISMSGIGGSGSNDNEDWLLTPGIYLNNATNPVIYFQAFKRRIIGKNISVLMSSNYTGAGNPYLATWTDLNINFSTIDTGTWTTFSAPLTVNAPLFVAFKYTCSGVFNDCATWRIDSLVVTNSTGMLESNGHNQLPISVLGQATSSNIIIGFIAEKSAECIADVYDLTGRVVYHKEFNALIGTNRLHLQTPNLQTGLYIIRLCDGYNYGVTKAFVEAE